MASKDEIRAAILKHTEDRPFQKVAMVISRVLFESKLDVQDDSVGRLIEEMVRIGELEAQGDVKKWRFAEIRQP